MAKHGFGIMVKDPDKDECFDVYEPEKYNCISVHDDYIEPLMEKLSLIDCYWHTLERPEKGINYCGISLVPPSSVDQFVTSLEGSVGTEELRDLLVRAKEMNKFIIHFGI